MGTDTAHLRLIVLLGVTIIRTAGLGTGHMKLLMIGAMTGRTTNSSRLYLSMTALLPVPYYPRGHHLMATETLLVSEHTLYRVRWTKFVPVVHSIRDIVTIGR